MRFYSLLITLLCLPLGTLLAGNPDRQGEAGAYELLLNPFARSAGLSSLNTAFVSGTEAMRLNVAGIGRTKSLEVTLANMQYLVGSDLSMSAVGFSAPFGDGQSIAVTLAAFSFGDIPLTTVNDPEGTGGTFSPTFFHIGIGYAKTFDERISVGVGIRFISETIFNASAAGFAVDAGVQYVTGEADEFKLGISLRNVGLGMRFSGDGIAEQFPEPVGGDYQVTANQRVADFELPFQLNIGASYDIEIDENNKLVLLGNFASNAFSRDNLGGGAEYSFRDLFMMRAAYSAELGVSGDEVSAPLTSGLSAGATIAVPLGKRNDIGRRRNIFVDYAYRTTQVFDGTHNLGIRLSL